MHRHAVRRGGLLVAEEGQVLLSSVEAKQLAIGRSPSAVSSSMALPFQLTFQASARVHAKKFGRQDA
jgi:hypothetical protein